MRQMRITNEIVYYAPNEKMTAGKYNGSQVLTINDKNKFFGAKEVIPATRARQIHPYASERAVTERWHAS
jgi:hypothetical protein